MAKILALETATDACSAALEIDGETRHQYTVAARQHTDILLPMISDLLGQAGLTVQQLDAIAYGAGPGSFTGVRVATSVTQGLAIAHDVPVIALSCLKILAVGAARVHRRRRVVPIMDARKSEIYWARYEVNETTLDAVEVTPDALCTPEELRIDVVANEIVIGTGAVAYEQTLIDAGIPSGAMKKDPVFPRAIDALPAAVQALDAGEVVSAEFALPIYLRRAV